MYEDAYLDQSYEDRFEISDDAYLNWNEENSYRDDYADEREDDDGTDDMDWEDMGDYWGD